MIYGIRAFQDKGKTALAVGLAKYICLYGGYEFSEIIANIPLSFPVDHKPVCLNNDEMIKFLKTMIHRDIKHKIIILDECDRLFPARFWQDKEQSESLLGLWQDFKMFYHIFWTAHKGTGVDVLLRETTQIEMEPEYSERKDLIDFIVYNANIGRVSQNCLRDVSKTVFPYYHRWKRVV